VSALLTLASLAGAFSLASKVCRVRLTPLSLAAVVCLYPGSILGIAGHALLMIFTRSRVPFCSPVRIGASAVIPPQALCQFFFALFWIGIPPLSVTGASLLLLFAKLRIGPPSLADGSVVSLSGRGVRKFSTLPLALSLCRLRLDFRLGVVCLFALAELRVSPVLSLALSTQSTSNFAFCVARVPGLNFPPIWPYDREGSHAILPMLLSCSLSRGRARFSVPRRRMVQPVGCAGQETGPEDAG
jgi:hypothetical protein